MAETVTAHKCPNCGGPLQFGGGSGKVDCEYCGSSFTVQEIEQLYAQEEAAAAKAAANAEGAWNEAGFSEDWGEDGQKMRTYSCPSCGAQLICDETTAATSCPYCGNPAIVPGQFGGTMRPDYVLPFKLSKEDAVAALKKHYQKKVLLPKVFSRENHIREIKGVYVPFWLFDGEAEGDMSFHATNSVTRRSGDYRVTTTSHYRVHRSGTLAFQMVPVDGSEKMPDALMDSIEPFDYKELTEFSTAYLPGFLADKYDVPADQASKRAEERCCNTAEAQLRDTVTGYESVTPAQKHISLKKGSVHYALLPVWLLTTKWKDQNYLFAMNGQTGRLVGDLPIDKTKRSLIFWSTFAGSSLILSLLLSGPIGRMLAGLFS